MLHHLLSISGVQTGTARKLSAMNIREKRENVALADALPWIDWTKQDAYNIVSYKLRFYMGTSWIRIIHISTLDFFHEFCFSFFLPTARSLKSVSIIRRCQLIIPHSAYKTHLPINPIRFQNTRHWNIHRYARYHHWSLFSVSSHKHINKFFLHILSKLLITMTLYFIIWCYVKKEVR